MIIKKILFLLFIIFQVSCQLELVLMPREGSLEKLVMVSTLNHYLKSINISCSPSVDLKKLEAFNHLGVFEQADQKLLCRIVAKLTLFVIQRISLNKIAYDDSIDQCDEAENSNLPENSFWNSGKIFERPLVMGSYNRVHEFNKKSTKLEKPLFFPEITDSPTPHSSNWRCSVCGKSKWCAHCRNIQTMNYELENYKNLDILFFSKALLYRAKFLQYLYKFINLNFDAKEKDDFFESIKDFLHVNSFISDDSSKFSILRRMLLYCELLSLRAVPISGLDSIAKIFALAACLPVEKKGDSWVYINDELKKELECLVPTLKHINPDMNFDKINNYIPHLQPPESCAILSCHCNPFIIQRVIDACERAFGGFSGIEFESPVLVKARVGSRVFKDAVPVYE